MKKIYIPDFIPLFNLKETNKIVFKLANNKVLIWNEGNSDYEIVIVDPSDIIRVKMYISNIVFNDIKPGQWFVNNIFDIIEKNREEDINFVHHYHLKLDNKHYLFVKDNIFWTGGKDISTGEMASINKEVFKVEI